MPSIDPEKILTEIATKSGHAAASPAVVRKSVTGTRSMVSIRTRSLRVSLLWVYLWTTWLIRQVRVLRFGASPF